MIVINQAEDLFHTDKEPYWECTNLGNATQAAVQTCADYGMVNTMSDEDVQACQDTYITAAQYANVNFITDNSHKNNPEHCTCADFDTDELNFIPPYTGYTTWCNTTVNYDSMADLSNRKAKNFRLTRALKNSGMQ